MKQQDSPIMYDAILEAKNLTIGYRGAKEKQHVVLQDLNLQIFRGEVVCLIGPNGTGKSTLIRTLAGMQPALKGGVTINGLSVKAGAFGQISKLLSVVLTDKVNIENLSVFNMVSMGRHPYTNWVGTISDQDREIIHQSLESVGMLKSVNKDFSALSDGEKQRVMIAKALAQQTPLILLDEPTAHLDLPNRVEIMKLLQKLARTINSSILLSTHELDLALQAADRLWMMTGSGDFFTGTPEDLVLQGQFEKAFKNQSFDFDMATGTFRIAYPHNKKVAIVGNSVRKFWTKRALERYGYEVTQETQPITVNILDDSWRIDFPTRSCLCYSIHEVLNSLIE